MEDLRRAGYNDQQIGYLYRHINAEDETKSTSMGSAIGTAAGAVGGGVLVSLLTAAAISVIPGIGSVVAGGIIFAALGGAALGAMAGGFVGMLVGLRVPEDDAHYYQGELEHGRTIVTVKSDENDDVARALLKQHGAYDATERVALPEPGEPNAIPHVKA
ncbi:membrane protein [Ktedonospora formicarum]|uniref:Membrane protein n=1 Tax=Ktedonospora formicarum TaxID=2778364 RepID=A0A8J3I0U7_9CHLR|nr:membrane protein [Ktedonospora formicarum]